MQRPLVSIIIPCYNAERWIGEAIDSALGQTYSPTEVIVIDDGSTDRSLEIIESYYNEIRYASGPNRGGCAARNKGLAAARGEFVQFLDADDVLTHDCVEAKLSAEVSAHSVVCSKVELFPGMERVETAFWNQAQYSIDYMIEHGSPQTAAPLHRSSQLRAIGGFREGLTCAQEYDLHLRLAILQRVSFRPIDVVGVLVRPVAQSVSRSAGTAMAASVVNVLLNVTQLLHETDQLPLHRRTLLARRLTLLARLLWRAGYRDHAIAAANKAKELSNDWVAGCYSGNLAPRLASALGFAVYEKLHSVADRFVAGVRRRRGLSVAGYGS